MREEDKALGLFLLIIYQIKKEKIVIVSFYPQHISFPRPSGREICGTVIVLLAWSRCLPSLSATPSGRGRARGQAGVWDRVQGSGVAGVLSSPCCQHMQTLSCLSPHHPPLFVKGSRKMGLQEAGLGAEQDRGSTELTWPRPPSSASIAHPGSDALP